MGKTINANKHGYLSNPRRFRWRSKWIAVILPNLLTGVAFGNVTGSGFQNFNPTADAGSFVTVHSAATLDTGTFNLGLFVNQAVNTLPYFKQDGFEAEAKRDSFRDGILSTDFFASYGVMENLELGLHLPQVMTQSVDATGPRGQFSQNGLTEAKISAKYNLWASGAHGVALSSSVNLNVTGNNPYQGQRNSPIYNAEIIAQTTLAKISLAANLGYRYTKVNEADDSVPIKPFGNQFIASLGAVYRLTSLDTDLVGEIYGSGSPEQGYFKDSTREASSAEALIGVRYHANSAWRWDAGAGTELFHGNSSPDYRFYAGVQWLTDFEPKPNARIEIATDERQPDQNITIVSDVLFKFNSDRLIADHSQTELIDLVRSLNEGKALDRLVIEGHTCAIGSSTYNNELSTRRADSIKSMLVKSFGIPAYKIVTVGKGERYPIASNDHEEGRQRNRRVEFKIYRISH